MDDQIAPVVPQGSDPIAAYRAYLEQNTGYRAGTGPSLDDTPMPSAQGQGPSIAPVTPQAPPNPQSAAPQSAPIAPVMGGGTAYGAPGTAASPSPTIDSILPNPVGGDAEQAPQADQAPQARKAKKDDKAKGAKQADQAPIIAPVRGQAPAQAGSSQPPNPSQPVGNPASLSAQPTMAGNSGGQISADPSQMTPASGHVIPGAKTDDGRPMITVKPPGIDDSDFGKGNTKLADIHDGHDLIDSLPKAKQSAYMDWWEQQHGSINQRYDAMLQDLGQRPDPNRQPTRKEMFGELMNFGLNLMRNARRGGDNVAAVGQSAQEAMQGQQAKQQQQTADYDNQKASIEAQRQNQLKDIGNYGNAVREDALITNANTRTTLEAIKALKPPKTGQPTTRILNDGTQVEFDPDTKSWNPSVDRSGNPIGKMPQQGPRGGAGKGPARMLEYNDLVKNQHVEPNQALALVYGSGGVKQADPVKTYNGIYAKARTMGETPEDAKAEAENMTSVLHGNNWRQAQALAHAPAIGGPPRVTSQADYDKLPKGAKYLSPDGRTLTKNQ